MPPSYKHIIHFTLLTPTRSSKETAKMSTFQNIFSHTHTSVHLEVRIVLYTHVKKKKYLYILNIWT